MLFGGSTPLFTSASHGNGKSQMNTKRHQELRKLYDEYFLTVTTYILSDAIFSFNFSLNKEFKNHICARAHTHTRLPPDFSDFYSLIKLIKRESVDLLL